MLKASNWYLQDQLKSSLLPDEPVWILRSSRPFLADFWVFLSGATMVKNGKSLQWGMVNWYPTVRERYYSPKGSWIQDPDHKQSLWGKESPRDYQCILRQLFFMWVNGRDLCFCGILQIAGRHKIPLSSEALV